MCTCLRRVFLSSRRVASVSNMGIVASAFGVEEEQQHPLNLQILQQSDSVTSNALVNRLRENQLFIEFSQREGAAILQRDNEDAEKLAKGIEISIKNGVLKKITPAPYYKVDVLGKSADEVAAEIQGQLPEGFKGGVLVLVGLSGTGKGTTVDVLKKKLPNATTWSNGNVFRSLTLLAATYSEQNFGQFNPKVLTPENIAAFMKMITFGKFNGKFDIHINGLGLDLYVSQVANTVLKGPLVGKNIPTVAEVTQGEVVQFASQACKEMGEAGFSVLLEGREQTVNYIETQHRFELTMSDSSLIGMRRAAQRINAKALELMGPAKDDNSCLGAVVLALGQLAAEKQ
eukprot:m.104793 g.104793  ORF g.104793 m.104793 type:complete len:344 (+) comp13857_c0_seq1:81-1112(+)